jgi:hypothetical protein
MKNFYILFLLTISYSITAQTFDFQSGQDQYGWISGGGGITDADLSITSEGLVVSWSDPGVDNWQNGRKPKLKHTNANVDADMNKIFGITLHNTSNLVTRVRVIHFKGLNGTDPTSSSGTHARYASFDIPATTGAQETFYYDLTNVDWINYNNAIEDETDLDMDHIQIQFVTASPANGFLTSEGSITIHSMSFINEIPSEERVDYNFSENVEGFIGQNGVSVSQSGGNLVLDISDTSPYPKLTQSGSFAVNADAYKYATVFLSENNSPKSRMTFVSPQGGNQFVATDITPNSTTAQEVNFDLSALDNWNGMINNFAFQIIEPTEEGAPLTSSGNANIDRILFSTENPLSVNQFSLEQNLRVFPNPAKDILNIQSASAVRTLRVLNVLGQEVLRQSGAYRTINVSSLSPGLYILKTEHINGGKATRKFIIQ